MKPTPLPWRVDLTYPAWPMIVGADGTHVNVDFENAADAFLIVRTVNAVNGYQAEADQAAETERIYTIPQPEYDVVEWWGVPVSMPS